MLYLWKKELREEGIIGLKNKSRAPINKSKRKSELKEEVKGHIKQYRIRYIGVRKEVIYTRKKRYCKGKWIKEFEKWYEMVQIDSIHLRY